MSDSMSLKKAALINASAKYSTVLVNLLSNAVLARILTPEDYGVVAIISVFATFFLVFADMGIGSAVIQNRDLTNEELDDIFSWTNYVGLSIVLVFSLFSFAIAYFYDNNIYISLGMILSLSSFFTALSMVPNALLMRKKKFVYVAIRNVLASIINFGCTLILALNGFKAYSIVAGTVVNAAVLFLFNYKGSHLKLKMFPRVSSFKKIAGFSMYQFCYQFVNYFSRSLDNILAGKFLGNAALGYYDKAYKLMIYPINNFTAVINPVLHPILSEYQNDKKYIYTKYIKLVKVLALVGCYCTLICYFNADEIIRIVYGDMWEGCVFSFKVLSLSIASQMVSSSAGSIYQSLGLTKVMFQSGMCYMVSTVVLIILGISRGNINSLAICVSVSLFVKFFVELYFLICKCFRFNLVKFLKEVFPTFAVSIITGFIITVFLSAGFLSPTNTFVNFLFKSALISGVYLCLSFASGILKDIHILHKKSQR